MFLYLLLCMFSVVLRFSVSFFSSEKCRFKYNMFSYLFYVRFQLVYVLMYFFQKPLE
ncbi:hypothetical protein HanIR_Chr06g0262811 [Helianthus annuus]|nr:hypothetical protein HanIR_Chr06g0262811 [Helianthus annuus]